MDMLDPSWKRVAAFDEAGPSSLHASDADSMEVDQDGEWEYEDEEELITLDLGPDSKRLVQMSQEYSIAGIETKTPFLQLGNLIFKGTWDHLVGTEILLQDEQETRTHRGHEHNLWPLPASATDRRLQRAPSTTRRRIIMRQATNMVAKEAALAPPDELPSTGIHAHAPILRRNKTGYVTYKNWVWVRGIGWIRKEEASQLERLPGSELEDGVQASPTSGERPDDLPDVGGDDAEEGAEGDEEDEEDVAEAQTTANVEDTTIAYTADQSTTSLAGTQEASRPGRKKMTEEEKVRYQLFRAMRKVADRRRGIERDGEDQSGDDV